MRALVVAALGLFTGDKPVVPLTASIQLPDPPTDANGAAVQTHQVHDTLHPDLPAVFDHGSHHFTFVDDNMMTAERDAILDMINASVVLAYFLYGFPGNGGYPPPLWLKTSTSQSLTSARSIWDSTSTRGWCW
jgi:hypothetical protein